MCECTAVLCILVSLVMVKICLPCILRDLFLIIVPRKVSHVDEDIRNNIVCNPLSLLS